MSGERVRGRALTLLFAAVLVVTGCNADPGPSADSASSPPPSAALSPAALEPSSPSPSPVQTASPSPTPSPLPATAAIGAAGGTVAVDGGAEITVPKGALKKTATATIAAQPAPAGPTDDWPADAVGPTWSIELGGAKLKKPVTISVPYEPGALLAGQDPASIVLAYRDGDTGRWIIVPSAVDPVTHTVTAEVTHLSDWGLFTVNWDYWIAFIGKAASGNLTDLLEAVGTLTTECETDDGVFEVSNKAANKLLKGCIRKVVDGRATIGVTNLRAIWLAIRSPASGGDDVAGPGDTITFKTGGAKPAQPVIASARMTETAFWYQLADLLVRLLPGGDELTKAASYTRMLAPLAEVVKRAFAGTQAYEKAKAGDGAAAVEALYEVLTGEGFLTDFAFAVVRVGQEYKIGHLKELTPKLLSKILLAANLVVLIGTLLAWDVQFLFGPSYGEVRVRWLVPPSPPTAVADSVQGTWSGGFSHTVTWRQPTSGGPPASFEFYGGYHDTPGPGCEFYTWPTPFKTVDGEARRMTYKESAVETDGCLLIIARNRAGSSAPVLFDLRGGAHEANCEDHAESLFCR